MYYVVGDIYHLRYYHKVCRHYWRYFPSLCNFYEVK